MDFQINLLALQLSSPMMFRFTDLWLSLRFACVPQTFVHVNYTLLPTMSTEHGQQQQHHHFRRAPPYCRWQVSRWSWRRLPLIHFNLCNIYINTSCSFVVLTFSNSTHSRREHEINVQWKTAVTIAEDTKQCEVSSSALPIGRNSSAQANRRRVEERATTLRLSVE